MSKIIRATCEENTVTAEGVAVPVARVLSKGLGASEGVLLIDEDRADYLTSSAEDLDESLEQVISALQAASSGLSSASSALSTVGLAAGVSPLVLTPLLLPISLAASDVSGAASALQEIKERLK